ncbi:hypothetical protein ABW19_dt0206673 [Dactylella cylindrospora]|nr:hypothetical protein ABW19_dt0206673 [Dactylella cylindrospora]
MKTKLQGNCIKALPCISLERVYISLYKHPITKPRHVKHHIKLTSSTSKSFPSRNCNRNRNHNHNNSYPCLPSFSSARSTSKSNLSILECRNSNPVCCRRCGCSVPSFH